MGIFNEFNKKEKPVFTGLRFGFGASAGGGGGAAATPPLGASASGGVIHEYLDPTPGTKYRCHIFFNPGTFVVTDKDTASTLDYLVVGGGGGGAGDNGGGGGGGGVYSGSTTIANRTYPVTVGTGGKGTWSGTQDTPGTDGTPSSFTDPGGPTTRTAGGGGGAGAYPGGTARGGLSPGGSGGGGAFPPANAGSSGNSDSGAQSGGNGGNGGSHGGGGGGGAGGNNGTNAGTPKGGGPGGDGYPSTILGPFLPSPRSIWGGGGGGTTHPGHGGPDTPGRGAGGAGGGGGGSDDGPMLGDGGVGFSNGWFARTDPGGNPKANGGGHGGFATGGGGGGGGSTRSHLGVPSQTGSRYYSPTTAWGTLGGDGGPGIVVFRYELPSDYDLTYAKATGGFIHKDHTNDVVYHVFAGPTYAGNPGPSFGPGDGMLQFAIPSGESPFPAAVLIVGGGGGGASADSPDKWSGGGGGGGGVLVNPGYTFTANTTCEVIVGERGQGCGYAPPGNPSAPLSGTRAYPGERSALKNPAGPYEHAAAGGGGGGHDSGPGGMPGAPATNASGGGGAGQNNPSPNPHYGGTNGKAGTGSFSAPSDGTGTWTGYANPGGVAGGPGGSSPGQGGGGGGGAASGGSDAPGHGGGAGGNGQGIPAIPYSIGVGGPGPDGTIAYFGGGGGGGSSNASAGGAGGHGGAGGPHPSSGGTSEAVRILLQANNLTGSGGSGGGTPAHTYGGPGGPGVVIIKYSA